MKTSTQSHFTCLDVAVVVCASLLLLGGIVGTRTLAAEKENRIRCASNLRQIGQAMQMYANNEVRNGESLPRTYYDREHAEKIHAFTNWKQPRSFGPGAPEANDVTAAPFLILRTEDIAPDAFRCPSSKAKPITFADNPKPGVEPLAASVAKVANFPGIEYVSYSFQNPYASSDALATGFKWNVTLSEEFALAADLNPGGKAVLEAKPTWTKERMKAANSPNHGGAGQNVLYGDGHVDWAESPFVGMKPEHETTGDNIYAARPAKGDPEAVMLPPQSFDDNILLPAADYGKPAK